MASSVNHSQGSSTRGIVFIDSTVADYQSLIDGVTPRNEVVVLDPNRDGVAQISEVLAQRSDISSVHIISHGSSGSLQLGTTQLNSETLNTYNNQLQSWSNALSDDADLLLYGCDVASGDKGTAFVQQLSQLTQADVAASTDLTGSTTLGGDWDLEVKTGEIESQTAVPPTANYSSVLRTINVAVIGTSGGDDSGFTAIRDQLNNDTYFDFNATLVSPTQVDTVAELNAYDVVVIGNNGFGNGDSFVTFAPALKSWVETGGGVVATGWAVFGAGTWTGSPVADINAIVPVNTAGVPGLLGGGSQLLPNGTVHPVITGVSSFTISSGDYIEYPASNPQVDSGATVLATASGQATVVVGMPGAGRSVYLGPIYSGYSGYNNSELRSGNPDRLLEQAVAWAARPSNTAPTTSGIGNITVPEDTSNTIIDLFAAFADAEDADANLTYTIASNSNSSLFSSTTIDPVTGQLTLNYAANANGNGNMTIRATDKGGMFVETSFEISVTPVNDTPTLANAIADQTATAFSVFNLQFADNTFNDVDGDTLTYTATLGDGSALPEWLSFDAATRTFNGSPTTDDLGTLNIKITANDGNGGITSDTFALNIGLPQNTTTNTIEGTGVNDTLRGGAANDLVNGGVGNDNLYGNAGDDNLNGGDGDDILRGGVGQDILNGANGNDTLYGEDGNDTLFGGSGIDFLRGGAGNDILDGGADSDSLFGDAGNDTLYGGSGIDFLRGGDGNDSLYAGADNDTLYGDAGDDLLNGGLGSDSLWGGIGFDQFVLASGQGTDMIRDFTDGQDLLSLSGGLTFAQLTISQTGLDTSVSVTSSGEALAKLTGIQASLITAADFA